MGGVWCVLMGDELQPCRLAPLWKSRVPEPSRTGARFRRSRSTRPAYTACRMMLAPPVMLTSLSPAASAARVTAAAIPSVTKVNVVAL